MIAFLDAAPRGAAWGNRTAQTVTAGSAPQSQFQFDNSNRMIGYSYDGNGNQLTTPDGATLSHDADNRMTGWSRSGTSESYQYHPGGWRVWKSRSFASDSYGIFCLYGPSGQLLAEREGVPQCAPGRKFWNQVVGSPALSGAFEGLCQARNLGPISTELSRSP